MDVVNEESIKERVFKYYRDGGGKTFYCGYKSLAKHYSVKVGGCTDWTGYAGSGKSELLLDILKNQSLWYGHKHLIHMPDAGTIEEVIAKLIHKMSGKQFEEFYINADGNKVLIENRVTAEEMDHYLPIVLEYFKILDPKKGNNSKAVSPKEFWQFAVDNQKELGIFSAVIDSWNYMSHPVPAGMRYDQYLEDCLSFRNELSERNDLHFHTIIHPKSGKKIDGQTQMPDMHDLKGGSEWANNGKSIIMVHREFGSTSTAVKINKAKPRIVGIQGEVQFSYDVKKGSFYEFIDGQKKFAEPQAAPVSNLNMYQNKDF